MTGLIVLTPSLTPCLWDTDDDISVPLGFFFHFILQVQKPYTPDA